MNSNQIVTIDLGSSRISVLVAEVLSSGAVKVISEESKGSDDIKYGIVDHVSGAAFKINELVKLLDSDKVADVQFVSVPVGAMSMKDKQVSVSRFVGKQGLVTQVLLDDMLDECKRRVSQGDVAVYDVIPLSFVVDGKVMDEPVSHKGTQITGNYCVIAGHATVKSELERCFDRTGYGIEFLPLAVEALSLVLLEDQEREDGCALINFGASTTTLAVYNQGALQQLLVVPLGGRNITKDIQELGIAESHAERLKVLKGCALSHKVESPIYIQIPSETPDSPPVKISTEFLATIIEARLDEISMPIFDAIENLPFDLNAGIVISGGGSKLNCILDFITEKTNLYTRFGNHSDWLSDDSDERFQDPSYAQLIGAVLLTDEYRKEHPVEVAVEEPQYQPKLPRKSIADKLADKFMGFFSDDTKFDNNKSLSK